MKPAAQLISSSHPERVSWMAPQTQCNKSCVVQPGHVSLHPKQPYLKIEI